MAWITKDSAHTRPQPLDQPILDQPLKDELEPMVQRYPVRRAAALPVLHAIQEKHTWIPYQAIEEAAEFLDIAPADMLDTATFYEEFFLRPKGENVVWVCRSIACEIMNSTAVMDSLKTKLGIAPGETTADGKTTLMDAECIGACGNAPCALVNHELHKNLTPDSAQTLLNP